MQSCGDAHLSNFGLFASPERRLVFDINDFDETLPGPWEWDVKRLAASLEIAGRDNGFPRQRRSEVVTATVAEYRRAMREFATWTVLRVWYAHADVETVRANHAGGLGAARRKKLSHVTARRGRETSWVRCASSPNSSTAHHASPRIRRWSSGSSTSGSWTPGGWTR